MDTECVIRGSVLCRMRHAMYACAHQSHGTRQTERQTTILRQSETSIK
ncbi:MAG: hypothetical protein KHX42_00015 [Prevotella sp.]|nr:hypothetical protein [Prevotella sp.]